MSNEYNLEEKTKEKQITCFKYLYSKEKSKQEGLYFPKRRFKVDDPSKEEVLNRIENQDFKGASEQKIKGNIYNKRYKATKPQMNFRHLKRYE